MEMVPDLKKVESKTFSTGSKALNFWYKCVGEKYNGKYVFDKVFVSGVSDKSIRFNKSYR